MFISLSSFSLKFRLFYPNTDKFDFIIYHIHFIIATRGQSHKWTKCLFLLLTLHRFYFTAINEVPLRISVVYIVKEKIRGTLWWIQPIPQLPVNLIEPQQIPLFCFDSLSWSLNLLLRSRVFETAVQWEIITMCSEIFLTIMYRPDSQTRL